MERALAASSGGRKLQRQEDAMMTVKEQVNGFGSVRYTLKIRHAGPTALEVGDESVPGRQRTDTASCDGRASFAL